MFKKFLSVIISVLVCTAFMTGCNTSSVLEENIDSLVSDYYLNYETTPSGTNTSIQDTLDLMLDEYISGIKKPTVDEIDHKIIDPSDDTSVIFDNVDSDCKSIDDMKAYILKCLSETAESAEFYIPSSLFSDEVLYDVVFNQICENYMVETMGLHQYTSYKMQSTKNRLAVKIEFIYFDGIYSIDEVKDMKKQVLAKAKNIIHDLDLANKTEYECVYAVNEYLCDNCVYPAKEPYSTESYTIYGALIEKSAVCEGYARSAQLIFDLCGIDSYFVTGDTPQGGHAWNLVKVDGEYYQLDITWNDSDYQKNMYFLVTDSTMSLSRTWDRSKYPASAKKPYS